MIKYCILGGGGGFGITTSFYLLDNAGEVIGIGRNPLRPEPFSLNIEKQTRYTYKPFHIYYEQDLLLEFLDEKKPDIIINFAAQGESAASWKHSWRYFETNCVALTKLVEELSKRNWLKHFIHMSTPEVYGSLDDEVNENAPTTPTSPYAASKLAFDNYLLSTNIIPFTILRPCNCYNPGQLLHRLIPKTIWCGLTGRKLPLHGGGKTKRSYMHTRDLARAIHLVAKAALTQENIMANITKIYNVSTDELVSVEDIVEFCSYALKIDVEDLVEVAEERTGIDKCYWLDSRAIREDLGWRPRINLTEGLDRMVKWGETYIDQIRDLDPNYVMRG